jgi:hypothetical protein
MTQYISIKVPKKWFEDYRQDIQYNTGKNKVTDKMVVDTIIEDTKIFPDRGG